MANLHDIGTAVAELLKSAGYSVTAADVVEGFERPTFFIELFQNGVIKENAFMERVNVTVSLMYHPAEPSGEVQVKTADDLTALFTRDPLTVKDRRLTIEELQFDVDNDALNCSFDLDFTRSPASEPPRFEPITGLEFRVRTRRGGKFII